MSAGNWVVALSLLLVVAALVEVAECNKFNSTLKDRFWPDLGCGKAWEDHWSFLNVYHILQAEEEGFYEGFYNEEIEKKKYAPLRWFGRNFCFKAFAMDYMGLVATDDEKYEQEGRSAASVLRIPGREPKSLVYMNERGSREKFLLKFGLQECRHVAVMKEVAKADPKVKSLCGKADKLMASMMGCEKTLLKEVEEWKMDCSKWTSTHDCIEKGIQGAELCDLIKDRATWEGTDAYLRQAMSDYLGKNPEMQGKVEMDRYYGY